MKRGYLVGGAVLAVGAAAAVATGLPSGNASVSEASTVPATTAEINRQTLVDRETEGGELGYAGESDVSARASGTLSLSE